MRGGRTPYMCQTTSPQKITSNQERDITTNYADNKEQNEIILCLMALAYHLKLNSDPNADVIN